MDQNKARDEQKSKPETRDPQKPKRFLLVRLEERIAPSSGADQSFMYGASTRRSGSGTI
jgi:hypothetical protein